MGKRKMIKLESKVVKDINKKPSFYKFKTKK